MPRAPEKVKLMAFMYVNGPDGVRGDWDKSAQVAGYSRPPRPNTKEIWAAIEKEVEQRDQSQGANDEIEKILGEADSLSWEQMAERARPIFAKIAAGKMFATTQQVQALKEILTRGEGKAGSRPNAGDERKRVLVLPVLGSDEGALVCPVCRTRYEQAIEVERAERENNLAA